jgi:hypothetical protein
VREAGKIIKGKMISNFGWWFENDFALNDFAKRAFPDYSS